MDLFIELLIHALGDYFRTKRRRLRELATRIAYLRQSKRALSSAAEASDRHAEAAALIELGNAQAGDPESSILFYRRALAEARQLGSQPLQISALTHLGITYQNLTEYSSAYDCYKSALELARQSGDRPLENRLKQDLDDLYFTLKTEELVRQPGKTGE